jgi:hypothetical protein
VQATLPVLALGGDARTKELFRASAAGHDASAPDRVWLRTATTVALAPAGWTTAVESRLPGLFELSAAGIGRLVLDGGLLLLVLLGTFAVSHFSLRRLFFLAVPVELSRAVPFELVTFAGKKVIVLSARPGLTDELEGRGYTPLDLKETTASAKDSVYFVLPARPSAAPPKALKQAIDDPDVRLIIVAHADPVERAAEGVKLAWAAALRGVPTAIDPCPPEQALPLDASTADFVRCWSELTEPERMVLGQLAMDGYPSPDPSNAGIVRNLSNRGLISHSSLAIVRPRFAEYVRGQISETELEKWEASGGGTVWSMLRVPLAASVTALLAILGNVAPGVAVTGAAVPAVAAALPVVLRMLGGAGTAGADNKPATG